MELRPIFFENNRELLRFRWCSKEKKTVFICPNATIADSVRSQFLENSQFSSITLAKFLNDSFEESDVNQNRKSKADLLLELGIVWKKLGVNGDFEEFMAAFNMLTELRSFSTNLILFEDIFENIDEGLAKTIKIFWAYMDQKRLIDEHQSCTILGQMYKDISCEFLDEYTDVDFVFWGFDFLSGVQIDLLKSMSIRENVLVPINKNFMDKLKTTDWIYWLGTEFDDKKEIKKKKVNSKVYRFPKGRMGEYLKSFSQIENYRQVLLCHKGISLNEIGEVPFENISFKAPSLVFENAVEDLFNTFDIQKEKTKLPEIEKFITKVSYKDPRKFKAALLFKDVLIKWLELSGEQELTPLDLKLLINISTLNLPRVYCVSTTDRERSLKIYGIEDSSKIDGGKNVLLCGNSNYSTFKRKESGFTKDVLEQLSAIGPIRTGEYEIFKIFELVQLYLEKEGSALLLEDGIEEYSEFWADILKQFEGEMEQIEASGKNGRAVIDEMFKKQGDSEKMEFLSATKLQSYLDCPQKFYFSYIEKIENRVSYGEIIRSDQLGILEHLLIEKFFVRHQVLEEEKLEVFAKEILENYLEENQISLCNVDFHKVLLEIKTYAGNGLSFLYDLKRKSPGIIIEFEKSINLNNRRGSIDCFIKDGDFYHIIDFKRSSASVPSYKEIIDNKKIQLGFYLSHFTDKEDEKKKVKSISFINLSDVFDSVSLVSEGVSVIDGKKIDLYEYSLSYLDLERETFLNMKNDKSFLANPSSSGSCLYCNVKNICSRGNQ